VTEKHRSYQVPKSPARSEQIIRQSRFIGVVGRADCRERVDAERETLAKLHPKAHHICWAYIAGPPGSAERGANDDGEPRGTAGRPMLTVLEHSGFGEIWAAVVRYFGGIKLGKGGLIRAYTSSVQQAIKELESEEKQPMLHIRLYLDYNLLPLCESLVNETNITVVERIFTGQVMLLLQVPQSAHGKFMRQVFAVTSGNARFELDE